MSPRKNATPRVLPGGFAMFGSVVYLPCMVHNGKLFRRIVLSWYRRHGQRDLPWRRARDPYHILVAEVMLQQTQVDRVKMKWPEFLRQFPTLKTLASAPVSSVIRAWKGMGYNRRALYLQKTAQAVIERFGGTFPQTLEELRTLPGVGEYTARALLVFAFGKSYIAPDVNVLRILHRSFLGVPSPEEERVRVRRIIALGDAIVTPKTAYNLNQALMDLGRTVCTAKNPKDDLCPLHARHEQIVSRRLKKTEPMFGGVPRRIWRGRIVELVRTNGKIPTGQMFRHLGIRQDPQTHQWLMEVLQKLTSDGLVATTKGMVALP